MNAACPRRVSLITALGLPAIPSPTICGSSGTVPAVTGHPCRDRLRLSLADSPNHADRIEFTCLGSSRPCYGLAILSPLLPTPHYCDAVTVQYRTALHRTETDFHRSIPSPSQAHERACPRRSAWSGQMAAQFARTGLAQRRGREPFNPARSGGTLRLGQPRSGQLPIGGQCLGMRPGRSGVKVVRQPGDSEGLKMNDS